MTLLAGSRATVRALRAAVVVLLIILVISGLLYYQLSREREAIERLEVEVVGASITRLGLSNCDIAIRLRFTNPSGSDTPTFWVSPYYVYINGELVATGSLPPTRVAAGSSVYQDLTASVEYSRVARTLVEAIVRGELKVEVRGVIRARVLFGLLEVSAPFTSAKA